MVREADAAALAADIMLLLAARGHDVPLAAVNAPRLLRLAALILAELGTDGDSRHASALTTMAPDNS